MCAVFFNELVDDVFELKIEEQFIQFLRRIKLKSVGI
jgi:hypothetical protein